MASGGTRAKGTLLVGTDKTKLGGDIIVPSKAAELLSVTPYGIPITFTADAEMLVDLSIESDDTDLSPTKIAVYVAPGEDASITTGANSMIYKTYNLNTPLEGGDVVTAHGTNINDPTTDPHFGCGLLYSDIPSGRPQTFWKNPGATSAYGTGSAAFVEGSTYRFNSSMRITNIYAIIAMTTQTISDSLGGCCQLTSSDFKTKLPQIYPYQVSFGNVVAASTQYCPTTLLWNVDIPTEPVVAVTESIDQEGTSIAGNAQFMTGVGFNKTARIVG